jgi:hypothetical protein
MGARLWVDPSTHVVYLFGGNDGAAYHNWLWSWREGESEWKLAAADCTSGSCPYLSHDPVLITNDKAGIRAVLPGWDASATEPGRYLEHYFLGDGAGWSGSSQSSPAIDERGDCDGDGERDPGWGNRCSGEDWWDEPGQLECDTLAGGTSCNASSWTPESVIHRYAGWATDFAVEGTTMLITRGDTLASVDVSTLASPIPLDWIGVDGTARDLDVSSGLAAVAAGKSINLVDISDASSLTSISEYDACGTAKAVEIVGDRIYHLTYLGIGETDISDPANPTLVKFVWILPTCGGGWNVVDIDPTLCNFLSTGEEAQCRPVPGCIFDGKRPLDVFGGKAYISFFKNLLVVDLDDPAGFAVSGSLRLDQRIDALRFDDGLVYINLPFGSSAVVDADRPTGPIFIGEHDVQPWVAGVVYEWGRTYALYNNQFHVATAW